MKKKNLDKYSPLHKTGYTSKGNQRKWKIDDVWYKADYMGYESLSEVIVSELLKKSSIRYPFVSYEFVKINYKNELINACASTDFRKEDQILIPLEKLFRQYTGESLAVKLLDFSDVKERIQYLVKQVESITGLKDLGAYITAMLEIDAFFLNEDRHTNNIAVLYNEKTEEYSLCPLFDQGLCLFADITEDYRMEVDLESCLKKIEAKPFCVDFEEQLDAAEELYGVQQRFTFNLQDVQAVLKTAAELYPEEVCNRVEEVLKYQMRKYTYLMH